MYPILYERNEKAFTTNGLGRLTDCVSCTCREERNGQFEVEFVYPISGVHYDDINEERIVLVQTSDNKTLMSQWQPFIIYQITRPMNGLVTVYAHHISYLLKTYVCEPFTATSVSSAFDMIKNKTYGTNPFTFWTDNTNAGTQNVREPVAIRSILGGVEGSVLDVFGGEYEFDRFTVRNWLNRGANNGVSIRYGKNLTGIESDVDYTDVYTSVVPFWRNEDQIVIGSKTNSGHEGEYAYQMTIPVDYSQDFENAPTVAQLNAKALADMNGHKSWNPDTNIKIEFQPLYQTEEYKDIANIERVSLCDTVNVFYEGLKVDVTAKVVAYEYDVINERYNSLELGSVHRSLSEEINKESERKTLETVKNTSSWLQKIINENSDFIKSGLGGYVVLNVNADKQPEEILIMDNPDKDKAVNVIRMNQHGIGFSQTGYNGTYETAWNIKGEFNANFIATGTLMANFIKGGTLTLGGADNGNGVIVVKNANNNIIGQWNKDGLSAAGDLVMSKNIDQWSKMEAGITSLYYYNRRTGKNVLGGGLKLDLKTTAGGQDPYLNIGSYSNLYYRYNYFMQVRQGGLFLGGEYGSTNGSYNHGYIEICSEETVGHIHLGVDYVPSQGATPSPGAYMSIGRSNADFCGFNFVRVVSNEIGAGDHNSVFEVDGTGYAYNWSTYSDKNLKENIEDIPINESEKLIYSLQPKSYNYIGLTDKNHGFIAQEVKEIEHTSDLVKEDSEGMLTLNYIDLIADMINVIQAQKKKIDGLEVRLARLEANNEYNN